MRLERLALGLAVIMNGLALGCGGGVITAPSAFVGGVWKLQSLETTAGFVGIGRPENYTVEFKEGSALSVKADCNACSGTYALSGESMKIGPLACTRAFCGAASSDTAFLDVLTNANRAGVRGAELSVESTRGVARFQR